MTEQFQNDLDQILTSLRNENGRWTESRTITQVIFPVLRSFGWIPENHEHIEQHRKVPTGTKHTEADIVLKKSSDDALIVEAKAKNKGLTEDHALQLYSYCSIEKVSYGVLTNGQVWKFFDCSEKMPVEIESVNIDSCGNKGFEVIRDFLAYETVQNDGYLKRYAAVSITKKIEIAWDKFVNDEESNSVLISPMIKLADLKNTKKNRELVKGFVEKKLRSIVPVVDMGLQIENVEDSTKSKSTETKNLPTCVVFGQPVDVKNFRSILIEFVTAIKRRNPRDLEYLSSMDNHWIVRETEKRNNGTQYRQIGNGDFWLNVNLNKKGVLTRCQQIRKALNINEKDLIY